MPKKDTNENLSLYPSKDYGAGISSCQQWPVIKSALIFVELVATKSFWQIELASEAQSDTLCLFLAFPFFEYSNYLRIIRRQRILSYRNLQILSDL